MKEMNGMLHFSKSFDTDQKCLAHLSNLKWKNGFVCRRCSHKESTKGRAWYYRRCKACYYDESCTAHTLFHKLKFSLPSAFMIVHQISTMKKGLSTCEISRQFRIHQTTAWYFKRKIQQSMQENNLIELSEMDPEQEPDNKITDDKYQSITAQVQNCDAKKIDVRMEVKHDLRTGNMAHSIISVEKLGKPVRDRSGFNRVMWTDGLEYASKDQTRKFEIDFIPGAGGNNFLVKWYIFNLRNWLRGTHHHISLAHLYGYLAEFQYRYNHRAHYRDNPYMILASMMSSPWLPYSTAIAN